MIFSSPHYSQYIQKYMAFYLLDHEYISYSKKILFGSLYVGSQLKVASQGKEETFIDNRN